MTATRYYFHEDSKEIYSLMDDDACYLWEDRHKDLFFAQQYFAICELKSMAVYIIDADEFEDEFIPIDKENFDEIQDWYGFDELTKQKIKKEMFKHE